MFDKQYRMYSKLLLAADIAAAVPALYAAYCSRFYLVGWVPGGIGRFFNPVLLPLSDYLFYLLVFLPVWGIVLSLTQRYSDLLYQPFHRQAGRLLNFLLVTGSAMGLATFALKLEISRPIFFLFFVLTIVILTLNRIILIWVLRSRNISEHNQVRILVVGTDQKARRVGEVLGDSEEWGYRIIGYVAPDDSKEDATGLNVIGSTRELPKLLEQTVIDEVIFCSPKMNDAEDVDDILQLCAELGIKTRVTTDLLPVSGSRVSLEFLDDLPLITFSSVPEHDFSIVLKRILDFVFATVSLLLLSPLMLLAALLIKFTSPGPIFYTQIRCGLFGRKFGLTKFRTMVDGAEDKLWEIKHLNEMDGPVFKMRNDPRVTPLGRILRRTSIDELPQLWNVIKGEMSIVGPRAPLVEEVSHYSIKQRRRLSVKPGITCLWQVSGRNEISFQKWMDMDLEYIDNWSVWLDLQIMLKTIPAVLTGRGAR